MRKAWDLSRLKFIMSGAEPIRAETMSAFFGAFAECGLRSSVFCSAYGLAEHVCGAAPVIPARVSQSELVSFFHSEHDQQSEPCGRSLKEQRMGMDCSAWQSNGHE